MPRARRADAAQPGGVPQELFDADSNVWGSRASTLAWLDKYGLPRGVHVHVDRLNDGPSTRHKAGAAAWAVYEGVVNAHGYPRWDELVALGVPGHGGDVAEERFAAAGVTIEEN